MDVEDVDVEDVIALQEVQIDLNEMLYGRVFSLISYAEVYYGLQLPRPDIDFSLRGQCAGQVLANRERNRFQQFRLRINQKMALRHPDAFVGQVIPHEVAHIIVMVMHGYQKKIKPHGHEWKSVMRDCFQRPAEIYHQFETCSDFKSLAKAGIHENKKTKKIVRFAYKCSCMDHWLSSIRHKRAMKGQKYLCCKCKDSLIFIG